MASERLRDVIARDAQPKKRGFPAWHERLPADVLAEVQAVRADWHDGTLCTQVRTLARSISEHLRSRGLPTAGPDEVAKWLHRRD